MKTNLCKLGAISLFLSSWASQAGLITSDGNDFVGSSTTSTSELIWELDESNQLVGAFNVSINDELWDVSFIDDSYVNIFAGSLDANTQTDASLFSQALGDQVFVNLSSYNFDSNASLTQGCDILDNGFNYCNVYTPYELQNVGDGKVEVLSMGFLNKKNNWQDEVIDSADGTAIYKFASLGKQKTAVYADWSKVVATEVPEPAGFAMFGLALALVARKKYKNT